MVEIERKFLVISEAYKSEAFSKEYIKQGFLNTDPERTVRVRVKEKQGFLTVKGITDAEGTTRFEWEQEIPGKEARQLLALCEKGVIEKVRYVVKSGNHILEVDEFLEENLGLVIAEIELDHVDEPFLKPSWLGEEVTGDVRYYNSQLSRNPFKSWK